MVIKVHGQTEIHAIPSVYEMKKTKNKKHKKPQIIPRYLIYLLFVAGPNFGNPPTVRVVTKSSSTNFSSYIMNCLNCMILYNSN